MFRIFASKKTIYTFLVFILFFITAFLAISDYGVSWDEPTHFKRGQGYLHFLLTGNNDYRDLTKYDLKRAQTDYSYHGRSIYEDDKNNAAFYRTIDGAHPPLSDILASLTNQIFYQKLGILGDVESYHLFEIFVASIGVAVVFLFVYESFGFLAAAISVIFFATYPLFWAESHFNIKDPIETTWIIVTVYFLWKSVKNSSTFSIFISSIFAGLALGTKFNIIFLPFIILPWIIYLFKTQKQKLLGFVKTRKFIIVSLLYPLVMFAIFYFSYPFLWENPIVNIGKVLTYYQRNALDPAFENSALMTYKFYALRWVLLTAPPMILVGLLLILIALKDNISKHYGFLFLIGSWFFVTLFRVSIPGVNIYGGVRQIMEYIPALSILSGVGISVVSRKFLSNNFFRFLILVLIFIFSFLNLYRLHPNENIYFNFLAGGVKGAVESGVPSAGNSFGNAYYQGLSWINQHAEIGAKMTIIQGSSINIPKYKLREDIDLSENHFSGINRNGEYIMALTFNWENKENYYAWEYLEDFLDPVYVLKSDGVAVLKIWKNDLVNTKSDFRKSEKLLTYGWKLSKNSDSIQINIDKEMRLSRINFSLDQDACITQEGFVETSLDGKNWTREKDSLGFSQVGEKSGVFSPAWEDGSKNLQFKDKTLKFFFAGRWAKYIRVETKLNSCLLKNPVISLYVLS